MSKLVIKGTWEVFKCCFYTVQAVHILFMMKISVVPWQKMGAYITTKTKQKKSLMASAATQNFAIGASLINT